MLLRDDAEHSLPEALRSTFRLIADAFVVGDFQLRDHRIDGVKRIDPETAIRIAGNIKAYGDTLAPLNEQTWSQSRCRGMEGYWQTTHSEPVSDLTLHAKVSEAGDGFAVVVEAVYVP